MSGQPAVLQVVILRDGLLVGTEVLIPGTYSVGSGAGSDLRLDDATVAEKHATLYFQNGKAAIQDAGSPSGIYVNGHRVTACQVRSVDEVACGPFVLKTRVLNQKPVGNQPPPEVAALLQMTPAAGSAPAQAPAPAVNMAVTVPGRQEPVPAPRPVPVTAAAAAPAAAPKGAPRGAPPSAAPQGPAPANNGGTALSARRREPAPAPAPAALRNVPRIAQPPMGVPSPTALAEELFGMPGSFDDEPLQPIDRPTVQMDTMAVHGGGASAAAAQVPHSAARPAFEPQLPAPAPVRAPQPLRAAPPPPPAPAPDAGTEDSLEDLLDFAPAPPAAASSPAARTAAPAPRPRAHSRGHAGRIQHGRPSTVKLAPGRRGKPQLYCELFWGDVRQQARSFSSKVDKKKPLLMGPSESAALPVYGFNLPDGGVPLAEPQGESFRVFVPPGAKVERCKVGEPFAAVDARQLETDGTRRFVTLGTGMAARFVAEPLAMVAYVAPRTERIFTNPLKRLPLLSLFLLSAFTGGAAYVSAQLPDQRDDADFTAKGLPPVAVRLIAPSPKKKEEAKKKLEQIRKEAKRPEEKKEKPAVEKVVKQIEKAVPKTVQQAPETKALKALAKLTAAGPAMGDMLAAVDKLGNGPGSKFAKTNYKLSGLIGKAPIASAGLGTFGLGGGGRGGIGTLGAEILRGKGGGGIGALGAGNVGHGSVGGTVGHATARAVMAQGSIDREAVAKVVNSHLQEVRACYEKALLKDPSLAGKVVLEWGIAPSGSVASVKTKNSTLRNGGVEACIINELKSWRFPTPKGGTVLITYPFLFNSVGY